MIGHSIVHITENCLQPNGVMKQTDLSCEALQQAFDHPEHGDNGERLANLRAWAKGEDTYYEIGTFESKTD